MNNVYTNIGVNNGSEKCTEKTLRRRQVRTNEPLWQSQIQRPHAEGTL